MVAILVILDGASEPLRPGAPTSLEQARTPALDALVGEGRLSRLATVAPGLPAGSECAIPALLGWTPPAPVDRGAVEAAAHEIAVPAGARAWRVDHDPSPLDGYAVHRLRGHRRLLVGPPPLPAGVPAWPEGVVPERVLDESTVVVGARGAAIGVARLMGAATVVPDGATGEPDSDLAAKARAALDAITGGATRVVVHVGGADEAAHQRDRAAKVAAIERADRELIAPLAAALRARGDGTLRVCPDHGCDPATGAHDGTPVPCLDWTPGGAATAGGRLTERAVAPPAAEAA